MTEMLAMTPLRRLRDGLSLAQIALGVAAVGMAGGIAWPSLALATVLVAVAWRRPLPAEPSRATQRAWTLLVLAALVATIARTVLVLDFLDAGVDFLLLLVVQRTWNRQRAREHAQLLLLGTLLMVVGAVINTDPSYPVLLAAYLVIATMALVVNNLMAEGERLGERVMLRLAHEGHARRRSLWRAAAAVAGLAAAGALFTFVAFPRWGVGMFLRGRLPGELRSGFSDEVTLGGFGTIKTDATVVMRIRPESPAEARTSWYLRGSSFDRYADGRWQHGRAAPPGPLRAAHGWRALADDGLARLVQPSPRQLAARPIPGFADSIRIERATIVLEDIGAEVLFVPSDPVAVQVLARGPIEARASPVGGTSHEVRVTKPPGPVQYRVIWRPGQPSEAELAAVGDPPVPEALAPYLQRSEALSPEVRALARRLAAEAPTRLAKVDAIMKHLRGFAYTLELQASDRVRAGADPLEGFLFDTRAGHCEYFATAMAVLLREVGVPTRIVNDVGEFWAVRQADAHSWVEVHFGPLGWITFDPTPPSGRTSGDGAAWWPAMTELLDALRSSYLEYVIDYDLGKQLAVLEGIGLRGSGPDVRRTGPWLLGGLLFGATGLLAWRRWGRGGRVRARPETRLLLRVLAALARRGIACEPAESPQRLVARLRAGAREGTTAASPAIRAGDIRSLAVLAPSVLDPLERFVAAYEAVRFGPAPPPDALPRLRAQARAVLRALRG
jgi:transglutaminase-like putative cysteine protease